MKSVEQGVCAKLHVEDLNVRRLQSIAARSIISRIRKILLQPVTHQIEIKELFEDFRDCQFSDEDHQVIFALCLMEGPSGY